MSIKDLFKQPETSDDKESVDDIIERARREAERYNKDIPERPVPTDDPLLTFSERPFKDDDGPEI